jgi:uncharacterized membrane protein YvbJ
MNIIEKQSLRKRKSILYLVEKGEYSIGYALLKVEELNDNGKLTEEDYDFLATYLEELLDKADEVVEEPIEEENSAEETENSAESTEEVVEDTLEEE